MNYNNKLDDYLLSVIGYLKNNWSKPNVGFVSCIIVDGSNSVYSTNAFRENGKILHAERNALDKYKKMFGKFSSNAVAVATLSPCIEFSKDRIGPSCTSLLLKNNIKRIHFGHLHDKQGTIETYKKLGFLPTLTENTLLNLISKNLLQFYLDNKNGLMNNFDTWIKAKRAGSYSMFRGV